jgi:malonate transporter
VAGVYLLCALVMVGATVALTRMPRIGWNDAPLARWWRPFPTPASWACRCWWRCWARSAGPAIVTIVVDMVITSSLCIALSRLDGAGAHGVGVACARAPQGHGHQPHALVHALGALASALQFSCPGPVDKTVAMLAET